MTEGDPMIYGNDEERNSYAEKVVDTVRQAIEEDRLERRKAANNQDSQQATLIGGTGAQGSIIQTL